MPCEKCQQPAFATHMWGAYKVAGLARMPPMNEAALCKACGDELYAMLKDSVAAQHMHYSVKES